MEIWTIKKLWNLLPDEYKAEAAKLLLKDVEEAENIWEWLELLFLRAFERGYFRYRIVTAIEREVAWKIFTTFYEAPAVKVIVYTNAYSDVIRDRYFWENFRDYAEFATYNVLDMVISKITECPTENVPDPWQMLFLEYYVPFFKRKVCRSGMLALKITPLTIRFVRHRNGSMYVSRYVPVFVLRADAWLTRTAPIDRHFKVLGWRKEVTEWISTRVFAGRGIIDFDTEITTARDFLRRDYRIRRIRDVIFRPYTVVHDFCRAIGKPEAFIDVDHCSLYAIPDREPVTSRLYRRYARADELIRYTTLAKGYAKRRRYW